MKKKLEALRNKIGRALPPFLLVCFFVSGWAAFIFRDIFELTSETDVIKNETDSLRNAIMQKPISKPRIDTIVSTGRNELWGYIDELITENRNLQDSLEYYSIFYHSIRNKINCDYRFSIRDSANTRIYSGYVVMNPNKVEGKPEEDSIGVAITETSETDSII